IVLHFLLGRGDVAEMLEPGEIAAGVEDIDQQRTFSKVGQMRDLILDRHRVFLLARHTRITAAGSVMDLEVKRGAGKNHIRSRSSFTSCSAVVTLPKCWNPVRLPLASKISTSKEPFPR